MTASGVSQVLLFFLLISSTASFGTNSIDSTCKENNRKTSLQKFVRDSRNLVSATQNPHDKRVLPDDPRKPIDRKDFPEYNAVGIVQSKNFRGSGWLTNECLVWTAKHVIAEHKNIIGKKIIFYVGQSDVPEKNFKYAVEGEVVASGNPTGRQADHGTEDWALIKLKTSIGKQVGFIPTAQYSVDDALTCKSLEVVGYPGEKNVNTLWGQRNCTLYPATSDPGAFNLGCPLTPGNSGSPMLCRESDGSLWAIGIGMQSRSDRPDTESYSLNFTVDWPSAKAAYLKFKNTCK